MLSTTLDGKTPAPWPGSLIAIVSRWKKALTAARSYLTFIACFAACATCHAQADPVRLLFDYPPNELTNMTFRAYGTNTIAPPVDTWPLLATFSTTNIIINLPQGITFVAVQASNHLGKSFFSNVAVGILPRSNVVPRLEKP